MTTTIVQTVRGTMTYQHALPDSRSRRSEVSGLGQRIRAKRIAAGWSQDDLTQELIESGSTIGKRTLSRYERGHVTPTVFVLARLAQALGCTMDHLAMGDAPGP